MLQYLATCTVCDRRFLARTKKAANPTNPLRYYRCGGRADKKPCRERRHVRAEHLEQAVWQTIVDTLRDPSTLQATIESAVEPTTLDADIRQLDRDIKGVNYELDRWARKYMQGNISDERFDRLNKEQEDRLVSCGQRWSQSRLREPPPGMPLLPPPRFRSGRPWSRRGCRFSMTESAGRSRRTS